MRVKAMKQRRFTTLSDEKKPIRLHGITRYGWGFSYNLIVVSGACALGSWKCELFSTRSSPILVSHEHGSGYRNRGIRSDENSDDERKGEGVEYLSAKDPKRERGEEGKARGEDRSAQGLVDGLVDHLRERRASHERKVLADTIEDDDGVVHGVTGEGQDGRDDGERDLLVRQREGSYGDEGVMEDGYNGRCTVDELKTEPEVHQHANERPEDRPARRTGKLLACSGSDDVGLLHREGAVFVVIGQGVDDSLASGVVHRISGFGDGDHLLIRGSAHIPGDGLYTKIVNTTTIESLTEMVLIRLLWKGDVDERAALEVHAARDMMPEEHREDSGNGEDEREA